MVEADDLVPEGTLLDGKFEVIRCIGRGGMGAVYEMRHVITKHRRALKMLHPQVVRDHEAVERFLQEASAAGTIDHPNIAETYDAGWLDSGQPYLVMELLEGQPLDEMIKAFGPLPVEASIAIVAQAARAVHAAHEADIIHRDLKPANLFVAHDDDGGLVTKVLDFGVGKFGDGLTRSHATRDGAFVGTPHYMSPEQFLDGKRVGPASDIYSLGVIFYEALTGRHPYPCDTLGELARKIMVEKPNLSGSVADALPPGAAAVMRRALAKEPQHRHASAAELADDLESLRDGPGLTRPHGSRWPSLLPPRAVLAERDALDETTLQRGPEDAPTVLSQPGETAPASDRHAAAEQLSASALARSEQATVLSSSDSSATVQISPEASSGHEAIIGPASTSVIGEETGGDSPGKWRWAVGIFALAGVAGVVGYAANDSETGRQPIASASPTAAPSPPSATAAAPAPDAQPTEIATAAAATATATAPAVAAPAVTPPTGPPTPPIAPGPPTPKDDVAGVEEFP